MLGSPLSSLPAALNVTALWLRSRTDTHCGSPVSAFQDRKVRWALALGAIDLDRFVDEVCEGKFVKRRAVEGKIWRNLTLYEAPYQPETLQFYKIKGVDSLSHEGMEFNRELRRVGYGYQIDRKKLRLD